MSKAEQLMSKIRTVTAGGQQHKINTLRIKTNILTTSVIITFCKINPLNEPNMHNSRYLLVHYSELFELSRE